MRLNISILVLASGLATSLATSVVEQPNVDHLNISLLEQNRLIVEQLPPTCNLAACVGLSGTITCVLSAITAGDPGALQRCVSNGLVQICSCADCIPAISNFLTSLGICVTSPTPPGNETDVRHDGWSSSVDSWQTSARVVTAPTSVVSSVVSTTSASLV